jgi:hypothetical protein
MFATTRAPAASAARHGPSSIMARISFTPHSPHSLLPGAARTASSIGGHDACRSLRSRRARRGGVARGAGRAQLPHRADPVPAGARLSPRSQQPPPGEQRTCRLKYSPIYYNDRASLLALLCLCTRLRKLNCCCARRGWRSWAKGCWTRRRTCTWTRRRAACSTPRRGTGGFSGCAPAAATGRRRGSGGGSSAARGCSGSRRPPTAPCSSATRTRCVRPSSGPGYLGLIEKHTHTHNR